MKAIISALIALLILVGCEDQAPTDSSAQLMPIDELYVSPGFAWFSTEVELYTPSAVMLDSVRRSFDPTTQKVVIFVNPSGICRGTTRLFPHVMKTLLSASVDMTRVEVWSMRTNTDKHPYESMIALPDFPSVYVFRNDVVSAKIPIENYTYTNADTLLANAIAR